MYYNVYDHYLFLIFSHLNSLIQYVLPQLKRKGKDSEKLKSDPTKKLLARYISSVIKVPNLILINIEYNLYFADAT